MKVLMLSKAPVVGAYQKKLEELGSVHGVDLTVVVPPYWQEPNAARFDLEKRFVEGYRLIVEPMVFNGRHHVHFYPGIGRQVARIRPDIFHIDEEPFNLATFHAMWFGVRAGCRNIFYTWANIYRRMPPPFSLFEKYNYSHAVAAMAGNQEAADILRKKGFGKDIDIIPQFGVDPDLFKPEPSAKGGDGQVIIGYLGRLVESKGLDTLVSAMTHLTDNCRLHLVGDGAYKNTLKERVQMLGLADRVEFRPQVSSGMVPSVLNTFDVLVLPSLTTKNWKEQFGRVLIEAMSCEVPVVGSSSGEIPNVIGDAGLVFTEGDIEDLAQKLNLLVSRPQVRIELGLKGRRRVIESFTQAAVARQHYELYRRIMER